MPTLDSRIDDLYKLAPGAFVAARNALAKTLAGDDAARVKRLEKPTAVPWAVNQVYWHARPVFDRLRAAGEDLRRAQVATLGGGARPDLAALGEAHRQAVARAVQEGARLARDANVSLNADALARTFEALSLANEPPTPPGRLTQPLQPAGFEALAGVTPRETAPARPTGITRPTEKPRPSDAEARRATEEAAAKRAAEDEREARRQAALAAAEAALAQATAAEAAAKEAWERATRAREEAERARSAVVSRQSAV